MNTLSIELDLKLIVSIHYNHDDPILHASWNMKVLWSPSLLVYFWHTIGELRLVVLFPWDQCKGGALYNVVVST
jgi:hypothetical protein